MAAGPPLVPLMEVSGASSFRIRASVHPYVFS
jgi:hypothetical protein